MAIETSKTYICDFCKAQFAEDKHSDYPSGISPITFLMAYGASPSNSTQVDMCDECYETLFCMGADVDASQKRFDTGGLIDKLRRDARRLHKNEMRFDRT